MSTIWVLARVSITDEHAILIDAGIPVKQIKGYLKDAGIPFERVMAVFVTHDHADHIKALGNLGEKCNIPVYATRETHEGINNNYCMTEKLSSCVHYVEKEVPFEFREFVITPFEVPHDGTDNVGYRVVVDGKVFCFVTDLGQITETASKYILQANYLIMEANYDEDMLRMGNYPQFLKDRITSPIYLKDRLQVCDLRPQRGVSLHGTSSVPDSLCSLCRSC